MTQFGDSDDRQNVPLEPERPPLGGFDTTSMLVGALLGTALGGILAWLSRRPRTDDEPPIRVKGGSILFDVLDSSIHWAEAGSRKKWTLSGGEKKSPYVYHVEVTIVHGPGSSETNSYEGIKRLMVRYGGLEFIELKAAGNRTMLTAHENLNQESDRRITHRGEISEIQLDNKVVYKGVGKVEMIAYEPE